MWELFRDIADVAENVHESILRSQLELPEDIALLDRSEQPAETVTEYKVPQNENLAVNTVNLELAAEKKLPAYQYSDAFMGENGLYHPARIIGIYKDSLKNWDCRETVEALNEWQMQEQRHSCSQQCTKMVINELLGKKLSEAQIRDIAVKNGWYEDEGGALPDNIAKQAELFGLGRESHYQITTDALMELENSRKVIVALDSDVLAYPDCRDYAIPNHTVELLDFDMSDPKRPMVILNDPGDPEGRGVAYPLTIFEKAATYQDVETGKRIIFNATSIFRTEV